MSKDESLMVKGLAILLMVFLHLFNGNKSMELCQPWIFIDGMPLVKWLTAACNPVPIFLLLSGYGLSYTRSRGRLSVGGQCRRLLKLYIHYWIVLAVFVGIGSLLRPDRYPGDWMKVIGNLTSWKSSYNAETWFLLPYACMALASPIILRVINRLGNKSTLLATYMLYIGSAYIISRYIATDRITSHFVELIVVCTEFLFSFSAGVVMQKEAEAGRLKPQWLSRNTLLTALLVAILVTMKCLISHFAWRSTGTIVHPVYCVLLVLLFICLPFGRRARAILTSLGRHSMVMWMTHTFLCYYLFKEFFYGFRYPLAIFAATVVASYLVSFPIMWAAKQVIKRLKWL